MCVSPCKLRCSCRTCPWCCFAWEWWALSSPGSSFQSCLWEAFSTLSIVFPGQTFNTRPNLGFCYFFQDYNADNVRWSAPYCEIAPYRQNDLSFLWKAINFTVTNIEPQVPHDASIWVWINAWRLTMCLWMQLWSWLWNSTWDSALTS